MRVSPSSVPWIVTGKPLQVRGGGGEGSDGPVSSVSLTLSAIAEEIVSASVEVTSRGPGGCRPARARCPPGAAGS